MLDSYHNFNDISNVTQSIQCISVTKSNSYTGNEMPLHCYRSGLIWN